MFELVEEENNQNSLEKYVVYTHFSDLFIARYTRNIAKLTFFSVIQHFFSIFLDFLKSLFLTHFYHPHYEIISVTCGCFPQARKKKNFVSSQTHISSPSKRCHPTPHILLSLCHNSSTKLFNTGPQKAEDPPSSPGFLYI